MVLRAISSSLTTFRSDQQQDSAAQAPAQHLYIRDSARVRAHPSLGMRVEVVERIAREAAESLLKLELLLVTVQAPLPLEQHALLVGAQRP